MFNFTEGKYQFKYSKIVGKGNIIGYKIFPKEEMYKNNIFLRLKESYPLGVRMVCLDSKDPDILNGYIDRVNEIEVNFETDRLILIIDRPKECKDKVK